MSEVIEISAPLSELNSRSLKAGDKVKISGTLLAARDQAHKRLCDLIDSGKKLPIDLKGQVIYYVGPTPPPPDRAIGSAGPTTSSRIDPFTVKLIEQGLKGMIGKGYRADDVRQAIEKHRAVHFTTIGGAGALLSKHIVKSEIIAYEDLGPEAIRKLEVVDFPAIVAYDSHGRSVYDR